MKALATSTYSSFTFLALLDPCSEWDTELVATGEMEILVAFSRRERQGIAGSI